MPVVSQSGGGSTEAIAPSRINSSSAKPTPWYTISEAMRRRSCVPPKEITVRGRDMHTEDRVRFAQTLSESIYQRTDVQAGLAALCEKR
jgi:hypothetical protein